MHIKTLAILFKRIKLIVIFIFFIILNFNLLAANYTIAGCVFYKSLNESLPFANLSLFVPGDSLNIIKGTVSDDDGKYILKNIEPGKYILKVSLSCMQT